MLTLKKKIIQRKDRPKPDFVYWEFLPESYNASADNWPVLIHLHGGGGGKVDDERDERYDFPGMLKSEELFERFPFITLFPQSEKGWDEVYIADMIECTANQYRVDSDRIYLTGLSMGGSGTFQSALAYPEMFAALVPICGTYRTDDLSPIAHVPIWMHHGEKDPVADISISHERFELYEKAGAAEVIQTVYPELEHNAWDAAYSNPEVFRWLLTHSRKGEAALNTDADEFFTQWSMKVEAEPKPKQNTRKLNG